MAGAIQYGIKHISSYLYASPARQCVMLLCLQPRDDRGQRLLHFEIETEPPSSLSTETDCFGNTRHVLNIHRDHESLEITARSKVEPAPFRQLPDGLGADAWQEIDSWKASFIHWDFTHPSMLARSSPALASFVDRNGIKRADDPLKDLLRLSDTLHSSFHYVPGSTSVASPIEHILESGRGVCQDYAHVMIAIARGASLPVMSRATCTSAAQPARRRRKTPPTLGSNACCRNSAGSASTQPTRVSPTNGTCESRWAATTKTCLQPGASIGEVGKPGSMWMCRFAIARREDTRQQAEIRRTSVPVYFTPS